MSDVDDDVAELGRETLRTSGVEPLRQRLLKFVSEHDRQQKLETVRRETSDGTPLSDLIDEGRTERQ